MLPWWDLNFVAWVFEVEAAISRFALGNGSFFVAPIVHEEDSVMPLIVKRVPFCTGGHVGNVCYLVAQVKRIHP